MSNQDAPFGLRPSSKIDGSNLNEALQTAVIAAADVNAFFINQPVKLAGSSAGRYPTITATGSGDEAIDYVIIGFTPDFANEDFRNIFRTAGAKTVDRQVQVMPARNVVFEIQADATVAATEIGLNAQITAEVGNTVSGESTVELEFASIPGGTAAPLKIIGISEDVNNQDITAANVNLYVIVNNSNFADGRAGV